MNGGTPPPPPNLKPPPSVKKKKSRKNLTIKNSEFEAWLDLKGEMSWTAIMQFVRLEYIRLRDAPPVVIRGGQVKGIERIQRPPTKSVSEIKKINEENDLKKQLLSDLRSFKKDNLVKVPKEELEAIKQARTERVKNRALI